MSRVLRVDLRFEAGRAEILGSIEIEAPPPRAREVDEAAGALEVRGPDGTTAFRASLPDPERGGETVDDEGRMRRLPPAGEVSFHSVEVPWPGRGSTLVLRQPPGAGRTRRSRAGAAETILPLEPVRTRRRSRVQYPVRIDPIWGFDNPNALTLAFMAEAFTAAQMPAFNSAVDRCIDRLAAIEPYASLLRTMKVARLEIPSREGNVGGDTVFKARFQTSGPTRVLQIDDGLALRVLRDHIPSSARALVVVNTDIYGGAGGAVTVFSCHPHWSADIAVHELGHSHFNLADEYSAAGQPGANPPTEANVSDHCDRARLKWRHLVDPATPLPSWRPGDPVPDPSIVGAVEGGKYQTSGVWRPSFDCKMNHVEFPGFCGVCAFAIRSELARHAQ